MAIAWLPGPAGTRRRVAKPSVEEPDAAEPARPDLWGARVSNDPGLPDLDATPVTVTNSRVLMPADGAGHAPLQTSRPARTPSEGATSAASAGGLGQGATFVDPPARRPLEYH